MQVGPLEELVHAQAARQAALEKQIRGLKELEAKREQEEQRWQGKRVAWEQEEQDQAPQPTPFCYN